MNRFLLTEKGQARNLIVTLFREVIVPALKSGKRLWLTIQEETRTLPQNAKFHAICTDLAKSNMTWGGKKRSAAQWKTLLVSGHAVATREEHEIVPGIEGEFINLRESTALMSVTRGSSLIEYSIAFCAANGVALSDPDDWRNWGLR